MLFNRGPPKQAQEVIFSERNARVPHPSVVFNNVALVQLPHQNYLCVYIDENLGFAHHIKEKVTKANKSIAVIKQLKTRLSRNGLFTLYKSFIRPHLGYADIAYDPPNNNSFKNKLGKNSV